MTQENPGRGENLFDPIPGDPLAERAARQIEDLILGGVLKDGAKLPGERDLARQLDISRPKLREALRLLESRGLIDITAGEGAFIARLSGPAMSPALIALYTRHPSALDDHLEYRRHQERFAARLAAERATQSDRNRLSGLVKAMKTAHRDGEEAAAADLDSRFHMAIVEAGYNRTLIHTMSSLYDLNRRAVFFSRKELLTGPAGGAELLAQHAAIAGAILDGDAAAAERRVTDHIDYVRAAMAESAAQQRRETLSRKRGAV